MVKKNTFKQVLYLLGFALLLFITLCSLPGCKSTAEINKSLIEHSRAVERSQNAQRELISIIDRAEVRLESIERTAGLLSGNIERLGDLFTEYDSIVRELIEGINRVKNSLGESVGYGEGSALDSGDNNIR